MDQYSQEKEWFTTWFDTPLYEKLYADRDQQEAVQMIDLLESTLPCKDYPIVLDLGCGRGRHSIEMARRGYRVTGLDLSEQALDKARKKTTEQGLDVRFVQGDMRVPIQESFDMVVNLFTTFGYFSDSKDDERVLDAVAKMVRPKGWFVLDFLNPDWVRKTLVAQESRSIQGMKVYIRRWIETVLNNEESFDVSFDVVKKEMRFMDGEGRTLGIFEESVRLYPLEWFQEQLLKRGFKLVNLFGDYQGGEFQKVDSIDSSGTSETECTPRAIQFYQKIF